MLTSERIVEGTKVKLKAKERKDAASSIGVNMWGINIFFLSE